jgi:hypothetical protein
VVVIGKLFLINIYKLGQQNEPLQSKGETFHVVSPMNISWQTLLNYLSTITLDPSKTSPQIAEHIKNLRNPVFYREWWRYVQQEVTQATKAKWTKRAQLLSGKLSA